MLWLNAQPLCKPVKNAVQFYRSQFAKPAFQFHRSHGGNPLNIKRAFLVQKRFFDWNFPTIAATGCGMGNDRENIQFIASGRARENEAGTNFGSHAEVNHPDLTGLCGGHAWPPVCPCPGTSRRRTRAGTMSRPFLRVPAAAGGRRNAPPPSAWARL